MEAGTASQPATEVLREHFEALGRHDIPAARWAPDVVAEITSQGVFRGREEIARFFEELFAAVPDAEMIIDRILGDEKVAAIEWRMRGNFTGTPLTGLEATGGWIEARGCDVAEVSNGRIDRITAYTDGMELARSIGLMPAKDSGSERALIQAFNLATRARLALRARFGQ